MIKLQNNAIFIADSHYNKERTQLFELLNNIKLGNIQTNQIFLMGDMFDFLTYKFNYFICKNKIVIELLNELSNSLEMIYLEGNHDFKISKLFPNIRVIPREQQPLNIAHNNKIVSIAHGDIFTPIMYNIFSKILRSDIFLTIVNLIDINYWFSKKLENKLLLKNICHKQDNFDKFIENRVLKYNTNLIIEGHYHQGVIKDNYINVPSLACENYFIKFSQNLFYKN